MGQVKGICRQLNNTDNITQLMTTGYWEVRLALHS